jgi:hypothetical protein
VSTFDANAASIEDFMATTYPNPITVVPMRLKELVRLLESKSSDEKMTRHRRIRMGKAEGKRRLIAHRGMLIS